MQINSTSDGLILSEYNQEFILVLLCSGCFVLFVHTRQACESFDDDNRLRKVEVGR